MQQTITDNGDGIAYAADQETAHGDRAWSLFVTLQPETTSGNRTFVLFLA